MMRRLRSDSIPNLLVMQYRLDGKVENLMVVPSSFFWSAAIEQRKPLSENARRAGWVGCNIFLGAIPPDGKIAMVERGSSVAPDEVRQRYGLARVLSVQTPFARGWTLATLNAVRGLGAERFSLADIYAREEDFARAFPGNRNLRAKIRQQLQVLRDIGLLDFLGNGEYRFRP